MAKTSSIASVILCSMAMVGCSGTSILAGDAGPRYMEIATDIDGMVCHPNQLYKNERRNSDLIRAWKINNLSSAESSVLVETLQPDLGAWSSRIVAVVGGEVFTLSIGDWSGYPVGEAMLSVAEVRNEFKRLDQRLASDSVIPADYSYLQHGRCVFLKFHTRSQLYEYVLEKPGFSEDDSTYPVFEVAYKAMILFGE